MVETGCHSLRVLWGIYLTYCSLDLGWPEQKNDQENTTDVLYDGNLFEDDWE